MRCDILGGKLLVAGSLGGSLQDFSLLPKLH